MNSNGEGAAFATLETFLIEELETGQKKIMIVMNLMKISNR